MSGALPVSVLYITAHYKNYMCDLMLKQCIKHVSRAQIVFIILSVICY